MWKHRSSTLSFLRIYWSGRALRFFSEKDSVDLMFVQDGFYILISNNCDYNNCSSNILHTEYELLWWNEMAQRLMIAHSAFLFKKPVFSLIRSNWVCHELQVCNIVVLCRAVGRPLSWTDNVADCGHLSMIHYHGGFLVFDAISLG